MIDPSAPPAWLLAGIMAGAVCLFIGFLYLVQAVKRGVQWLDSGRVARPRPAKSRMHLALRKRNGQFHGSVPIVPKANDRSGVVSASERDVPQDSSVPALSLSVPDLAVISFRLGQGVAPSDVAKTLPGYSARNYKEYAERVRQVRALLDQIEAANPPKEHIVAEVQTA